MVFFGTGSIIVSKECNGIIQAFGIGIVFGLTVWILVHFFGKITDCHINPAVTIGFLCLKQITFRKAVLYIVFQLSGALLASLLLKLIFPVNQNLGNTIPSGSWQESFLLEFFLSFVLMLVILVTTTQKPLLKFASFLIGFTVFLEAWLAGPICGASMNPARSFGPALVSNHMDFILLYFLAPILAMLLVVLFWKKCKK
ncbi:MAG: aquaporin [Flavobacterium sp.]|nr:aquaporin [Flavobacterium sp.]